MARNKKFIIELCRLITQKIAFENSKYNKNTLKIK